MKQPALHLLTLLVALSCARGSHAQAVIDQSFLLGPTVQAGGLECTANQWDLQTFTVGIDGRELQVECLSGQLTWTDPTGRRFLSAGERL